GAATCVAAYSERWELQEDAKVDIKGHDVQKLENGNQVLWIEEDELERFKESAEVCPVTVIHIYDEKGNKII
ncbi:MAG: ferredoxin, partial [Nanoarchaeota archaeon]